MNALFCWSLLIVFSFTLLGNSCNREAASASLKTQRAARYLIGKDSLVTWRLERAVDPYQGGTVYTYEKNPHYLMLFKDGRFVEQDDENRSEGKYFVSREKDRMALSYETINATEPDTSMQNIHFRYEIRKRTDDSLVLAIQGRHGMVEQTYVAVRQQEQEEGLEEIDE